MRGLSTLALGLAAILTAAGCSASEDDASDPLEFRVALGQAATEFGAVFVAQTEGIFEENGLDVDLNPNGGTSATAQVTSGQIDLSFTTQSIPLTLASQGQDTTTVWAAATNTLPGIVGPPGSALESLRTESGCVLASNPPGSFLYAMSVKLIEAYDLPCEISGRQPTSIISTVSSGNADVAVSPVSIALPAVEAGEVELLVDPRDPPPEVVDALEPGTVPVLVGFGMTENLEEKREAVERFVASLHEAGQVIADSTPEELTALFKTELPDVFGSASDESLTTSWELTKQDNDLTETRGRLDESSWGELVDYIGTWGVADFDPGDAENAYDRRVDMSYWEAATAD